MPAFQHVIDRSSSALHIGLPLRRAAAITWSLNHSVRALHIIAAASLIAYVFFYVNLPTYLLPGATHDDGLYISHAFSIVSGQWLGPYNQYTLMKGPGYPLFLAAMSLFRIPIPLAHALMWGISVWVLSYCVYRLIGSVFLSLAVFEISLWNLGPHSFRVIRDEVSTPQLLIAFSTLLLALFVSKKRSAIRCAVFAGFMFGWFWITREEGIITLPAILLLFGCAFHQSYRTTRSVKAPSFALAGFLSAFVLVLAVIASIDLKVYGTFAVADINGPFKSALEALESVQPDVYVPFASVPKSTRAKIYSVSPTFAQLRPIIDGPSGGVQAWKSIGCPTYPNLCDDYPTGWFLWALRDAVAAHGDYSSAAANSNFYRKVHDEVKHACDAHTLSCYHNWLPFMPHIPENQWLNVVPSMRTAIEELSFVDPPPLADGNSLGTDEQIRSAAHFLDIENHTPPPAESGIMINHAVTRVAEKYRGLLTRLYTRRMPVLLVAGLISTAVLLLRCLSLKSYSAGVVAVCAAWTLVFCRLFTLTLVEISSFHAIVHLYIGYSFVFAGFAAALSVALLLLWLAESLDWYGLITSNITI